MNKPRKRRICKDAECPAYYDPCLWSGGGDNPAHIIVVGPAPSGFSIGKGQAFYGRHGRLFQQLLSMVRRYRSDRYANVKVYYTYATMVGAYKPKAKHITSCRPILEGEISKIKGAIEGQEPVIIPLGPVAAKAVGLKFRKISEIVGRELTTTFPSPSGIRRFTAIPLLSMKHLETKIGTANVVLSALLRAVRLACEGAPETKTLEQLTHEYTYPKTIEEIEKTVDHIIGYYDSEGSTGPEQWAISLDTETNTLHPYFHPDPRTLMLSCAWDDGKATTILLDHPETPYDPEEAWRHVERLLQCSKPKVFHNWKFDMKFLERVRQTTVNRVAWDTMLGEHFLDEDKKGHYGLKQLTPIYTPGYQGYDDDLRALFRGEDDTTDSDVEEDPDEAEPLFLKQDEILARHELLGCPDDRDDDEWNKLIAVLKEKVELKAIKKKERTSEQQKRFGETGDEIKQLLKQLRIFSPSKKKKGKDKGFEDVPLETILQYAAVDADVTRLILKAQTRRLQATDLWEEGKGVMKHLYLPGSRTLSDMEWRGFKIDVEHLEKLLEEVKERRDGALEVIRSKFSPTLNLNSPQQVVAMMEQLNFESLPGEEAGGTAKDILEKYEKKYPSDDPRYVFVTKLMEFREAHKTYDTYLKPIRRYSRNDGFVHCSFNLHGTATGRLSSAHPNMQNIPYITARRLEKDEHGKEVKGEDGNPIVIHPGYNIKKLFIASNPDNAIVNVDIKGAELRVYTAYSKDEIMINALNQGMDIHSLVTSRVYKIPYDEVQAKKEDDPDIKTKRTNCKRTVFGTFYGAGPFKISQQIASTVEKAQELQNYLFSEFPAIRAYVDDVTSQVNRTQMVKTFFGRCRRFRMAHVSKKLFGDAQREAVNFLIQSTSSDLVLSQLCEMDRPLYEELGGRLILTVHDSMTFEIPKKNLHKLHAFMDHWIIDRVRQKYDWLPVPFLYDVEHGPSYGTLEELKRPKEASSVSA